METRAAFHFNEPGNAARAYPEDIAYFRSLIAKIRPMLREAVFNPQADWRHTVNAASLEMTFSLWKGDNVGFILFMEEPGECYAGLYCRRRVDGAALRAIIEARGSTLRKHFSMNSSGIGLPLISHFHNPTPSIICRRLKIYRDVLTPIVDMACPRRTSKCHEKRPDVSDESFRPRIDYKSR